MQQFSLSIGPDKNVVCISWVARLFDLVDGNSCKDVWLLKLLKLFIVKLTYEDELLLLECYGSLFDVRSCLKISNSGAEKKFVLST
jgi:hypothetical protein